MLTWLRLSSTPPKEVLSFQPDDQAVFARFANGDCERQPGSAQSCHKCLCDSVVRKFPELPASVTNGCCTGNSNQQCVVRRPGFVRRKLHCNIELNHDELEADRCGTR